MTATLTDTQILAQLLAGEPPAGEVHWPEIVKLTRRYGCAAWLFTQLKPQVQRLAVPDPIWQALRLDHLAAAARDAQREAELVRLFAALQTRQIPTLTLKGTALAYQVYAAPRFRSAVDVDLLVRPEDVARAQSALESLGYRLESEPPQRINPFNTGFTGEIVMRRIVGAAQFVVEIHWEIIISDVFKHLSRLRLDDLWQRSTTVKISIVEARVLSREDALLHTCVHLALHGFTHLKGYLDIRQLAVSQPLDWDQFMARAIASRTRVACYFSLWWARTALNATIPDEVLRRLRPNPVHAALGYKLVQRGALAGALPGHAWEHIVQLALADRCIDWLRVLVWLFFPGPRWLRERYRLSSRGQALVWVAVHPCLVVREGLSNLWALIKRK